MKTEYYLAYSKWMTEFLHKWDYTILMVIVLMLAFIGIGALCWLYEQWLFNSIEDN